MRFAITLLCVALGNTLAGCATDSSGCSTDTCRAQQAVMRTQFARSSPPPDPAVVAAREQAAAEARHRAAVEECTKADANPAAADPALLKRCRAWRWQYNPMTCTDIRVGERFVEVTCEAPYRGGPADSTTASEMSEQRAAVATLAAGFTHLAFAGEQPPEPRYPPPQAVPVTCAKIAPTISSCIPQGVVQGAPTAITFRRRFEMLTETEALGRVNPNVPPARQPKSAIELTRTYAP